MDSRGFGRGFTGDRPSFHGKMAVDSRISGRGFTDVTTKTMASRGLTDQCDLPLQPFVS